MKIHYQWPEVEITPKMEIIVVISIAIVKNPKTSSYITPHRTPIAVFFYGIFLRNLMGNFPSPLKGMVLLPCYW